jgi:hypothetical protein
MTERRLLPALHREAAADEEEEEEAEECAAAPFPVAG